MWWSDVPSTHQLTGIPTSNLKLLKYRPIIRSHKKLTNVSAKTFCILRTLLTHFMISHKQTKKSLEVVVMSLFLQLTTYPFQALVQTEKKRHKYCKFNNKKRIMNCDVSDTIQIILSLGPNRSNSWVFPPQKWIQTSPGIHRLGKLDHCHKNKEMLTPNKCLILWRVVWQARIKVMKYFSAQNVCCYWSALFRNHQPLVQRFTME
jgi:hypothetical protein